MKYLIIIFLLVSSGLVAQKDDVFFSDFLLEDVMNKENVAVKYLTEDFSELWTQTKNHQIKGMIGINHQRIRIALTSISKSTNTPGEYKVVGKSKVKTNICEFTGIIRIDSVLEVSQMHYGVDNMYMDSSIVAQGIVFASYEFNESREQSHGTFNGKLMTKWYLNSKGEMKYDNIQSISDGYMNNAYVGTWTQYGSDKSNVCNWADYRIPHSPQDFDIGAGEFSPSEKYYEFGWEQYQKAWLYGEEQAKREELAEWWK